MSSVNQNYPLSVSTHMAYLFGDQQTITNFSDKTIEAMYDQGFVFTRRGKGEMDQTRSVRINLNTFEPTSENRRVLKRTSDYGLQTTDLPYTEYDWTIGKMAKDFYETKFGKGIFSANKIRELLTNTQKNNFNRLFVYSHTNTMLDVGYAVCFETPDMLHYSYPFYEIQNSKIQNLGIGMMTKAVQWAKENKKQYIYLGSAQRPTDVYKLQFEGLEWFDGKMWNQDIKNLKNLLQKGPTHILQSKI